MRLSLSKNELLKIYKILKAIDEGIIANPSEEWELDFFDAPLLEKLNLKLILKKIEKSLPKEEYSETKKDVLRRRYHTFSTSVDSRVHSKLVNAFDNRRRIEIEYFSMGLGETRKRQIDIYYMSSRYIIAYCHLRKAMRKFRVSKVVKAKPMN